ncbi:MAG: hypothetical protein RLY29_451, partial [Actinomycetota bacterium]
GKSQRSPGDIASVLDMAYSQLASSWRTSKTSVRRIFARLLENEIPGEIGLLPFFLELSSNQAG